MKVEVFQRFERWNQRSRKEYFDWLVLINGRLIASGPVDEVFTPSILEQAYGKVMIHPEISQG